MSFMHRFFQGVEYLQQAKLDVPFWAWNSVISLHSLGSYFCLIPFYGYHGLSFFIKMNERFCKNMLSKSVRTATAYPHR
jgi:hypothetical protein